MKNVRTAERDGENTVVKSEWVCVCVFFFHFAKFMEDSRAMKTKYILIKMLVQINNFFFQCTCVNELYFEDVLLSSFFFFFFNVDLVKLV